MKKIVGSGQKSDGSWWVRYAEDEKFFIEEISKETFSNNILQKFSNRIKNKKYSCIITCHNYEKYLKDCIISAKNQTIPFDDIIVIDDNSDNQISVSDICNQLEVENHKVEFSNVNLARDFGMKKSIADYYLFLDADNILKSNFLEKLFIYAENYQNLGVVYSKAELIDENNEYLGEYVYILPFNKYLLHRKNIIDTCCLIKREALSEIGGWSANGDNQLYSDWEVMLKISSVGWEFKHIDEYLFSYRIHKESMSSKLNHKKNRTNVYSNRNIAIITLFSGKEYTINFLIENYKKILSEVKNINFIIIDNSNSKEFKEILKNKLKDIDYNIISNNRQPLNISNLEFSNSRKMRLENNQFLGEHISYLYSSIAKMYIPNNCEFVLTIEDDIEIINKRFINKMFESMDENTMGVSGIIKNRFSKDDSIISFQTDDFINLNAISDRDSNDVIEVSATGFGFTMWRREVWDIMMPKESKIGNNYWHDLATCKNIIDNRYKIKVDFSLRTNHWHKTDDLVIKF